MNEYKDELGRYTTHLEQVVSRVGVSVVNKYGSKATIIKYANATDIVIQYNNGFIQNTNWRNFYINREFHSPLCKTVCGIGYFGIGEYPHSHQSKDMWIQMIHRVYDEKKIKSRPTYKECNICEEWHNFQNFAKWYDDNYYQVEDYQMHLDKDILVKNNKTYSPETCLIVPSIINALFVKRQNLRGECPIGVSRRKDTNKYRVSFTKSFENGNRIQTKRVNYGQYDIPEEAFYIYKIEKEKYLKEVAEYYKDSIPNKVYDAICNYKVEIND